MVLRVVTCLLGATLTIDMDTDERLDGAMLADPEHTRRIIRDLLYLGLITLFRLAPPAILK